jgi:hypothetical protein
VRPNEISCESTGPLEISGMRLRPLALLVSILSIVGCSSLPADPYIDCNSDFSRIVSTDFTGNIISEWVGVGKVRYDCDDKSYDFLAVEKYRHGRFPVRRRYVIGRKVKVIAPNVIVHRIAPPEWICPGGATTAYAK